MYSDTDSDTYADTDVSNLNLHVFENWLNMYFDQLTELYDLFRKNGELIFGGAFNQFGNFYEFARYAHTTTITPSRHVH